MPRFEPRKVKLFTRREHNTGATPPDDACIHMIAGAAFVSRLVKEQDVSCSKVFGSLQGQSWQKPKNSSECGSAIVSANIGSVDA